MLEATEAFGTARVSTKQSPTHMQVNIKPHTKGLFTLVFIIQYIIPAFNKKLQSMLQGNNIQSKEIK